MLQNDSVDAVIAGRVTAKDDVGRDILLYAASALHEGIASHMNPLLHDDTAALYGAVINGASTGDAHSDTENTFVVNGDIVANVNLIHEEISVADGGGFVFIGASGNDHVFADAVVVSDDNVCLASFNEVEILWRCADDGVLIYNITTSHCGAFKYAGMRLDHAVVADSDIFFDVGERADFYVSAEPGLRMDVC